MGWRDEKRDKRASLQQQWQEEARGGRGEPGSSDPDDYVIVALRTTHLGGLGGVDPGQVGQLRANVLGLAFTNMYGTELIPWVEITAVLVEDHQEGKSRVGPVVAFGVLGLGAKGTQTVTEVVVHLLDGRLIAFAIVDDPASAVRARLAPTVTTAGLHLDRPPSSTPKGPGGSFVDELERLAALHERGILSDEELATAKRKLLGE